MHELSIVTSIVETVTETLAACIQGARVLGGAAARGRAGLGDSRVAGVLLGHCQRGNAAGGLAAGGQRAAGGDALRAVRRRMSSWRACRASAARVAASRAAICGRGASWRLIRLRLKTAEVRAHDDPDCGAAAGNSEEERRAGGGAAGELRGRRRAGAEPGLQPRHGQDGLSGADAAGS